VRELRETGEKLRTAEAALHCKMNGLHQRLLFQVKRFQPTVLGSAVALMVRRSVRLSSVCRLSVCNVLYCG